MTRGASRHPPRISGHHSAHIFPLACQTAAELSSWTTVVPFFLPVAPPGILSYRYRARKMVFRPFRPFRTALNSVAVSGRRAMAGLCAISASVMPISRLGAGRPLLPGICNSRNFRKRYANGQWLGMAGAGRRIARARNIATAHASPSHRGPEIDVRRGRAQCHRAMALREIIEASEHDAGPARWGSADIRHNIAQERQGQDVRAGCSSGTQDSFCTPRRGRARVHAVHAIATTTSIKSSRTKPAVEQAVVHVSSVGQPKQGGR